MPCVPQCQAGNSPNPRWWRQDQHGDPWSWVNVSIELRPNPCEGCKTWTNSCGHYMQPTSVLCLAAERLTDVRGCSHGGYHATTEQLYFAITHILMPNLRMPRDYQRLLSHGHEAVQPWLFLFAACLRTVGAERDSFARVINNGTHCRWTVPAGVSNFPKSYAA